MENGNTSSHAQTYGTGTFLLRRRVGVGKFRIFYFGVFFGANLLQTSPSELRILTPTLTYKNWHSVPVITNSIILSVPL